MTALVTHAFRSVGPADAVPNNYVVPYYIEDRQLRVAIARVGDRLYAFDDLCTCTTDGRCPLSGGMLIGTTVMCQCHGSRFDVASGAVISGAATNPLTTYDVSEIDGHIHVLA